MSSPVFGEEVEGDVQQSAVAEDENLELIIQDLIQDLERLQDTEAQIAEGEQLEERALLLTQEAEKFSGLSQCVLAFRDTNLSVGLDDALLEDSRKTLIAIEKRFKEDSTSIIRPRGTARRLLSGTLAETSGSTRETLEKAWASCCNDQVAGSDTVLLSVLKRLPPLQEKIRAVNEIAEQVDDAAESLPLSRADFTKIRELGVQYRTVRGDLDLDAVPDNAMEFLEQAASGQGVSLDALDDSLHTWVMQNQLGKFFSVALNRTRRRR